MFICDVNQFWWRFVNVYRWCQSILVMICGWFGYLGIWVFGDFNLIWAHGYGAQWVRLDLSRLSFLFSSKAKGAGSITVIGAGSYYWCRPIGAGWKTGTYSRFPTGTNDPFCSCALRSSYTFLGNCVEDALCMRGGSFSLITSLPHLII